jgi:anti-sigma factor RsiW
MKADCQGIRSELSAYLDNEIAPAERSAIEKHLDDCPHCQRELEQLKSLTAAVTALPTLEPPARFLAEVRRKIAGESEPRGRTWPDYLFRPYWLKIPLETVAALVIIAIVMSVERPASEHQPRYAANEIAGNPTAPELASDDSRARAWQAPRRSAVSATDAQLSLPAPAGPVAVAQSAPTEPVRQREPAVVVEVHAKDFEDARSQIQQITIAMGGRFVSPPDREPNARTVMIELPEAEVALFKSRLVQATESSKGREAGLGTVSSFAMTSGFAPAALTGKTGSNLVVVGGSEGLSVAVESKAPTVVLEIRVVPPAN